MSKKRLEQLLNTIADEDRILIVPHNNPDPDAIASAAALRCLLADQLGLEGQIAFQGIIGRAENKALVHQLGQSLLPLAEINLVESIPIALVDTQPGAGNNALPIDQAVAIVIDHHPRLEMTQLASFVDVRPEIGASSTILTGYFQAAGLEPSPLLATALFYGIKTDTRGLGRKNASPADVAAYAYLQPLLDVEILAEIEHAQVPIDYFRNFDMALRAVRTYNGVVIAYLGAMNYPDMAAETAEFLLRLKGSQWVICFGRYEDVLNLSIRTRQWQGESGRLAQAMVGRDGTAGGHGLMAGGQVPLKQQEPGPVVQELSRRALRFLKVAPETPGETLI